MALYPDQDHAALGDLYIRHVEAMTAEGLHAKSDIAAQLAWRDAEIARLQAQVAELQALSVRNILLAIVPGDGSGEEVYAQSVGEVEDLLTKLSEQVDALADALQHLLPLVRDHCDEGPEGEGWQSKELVEKIAAADSALAAVGR